MARKWRSLLFWQWARRNPNFNRMEFQKQFGMGAHQAKLALIRMKKKGYIVESKREWTIITYTAIRNGKPVQFRSKVFVPHYRATSNRPEPLQGMAPASLANLVSQWKGDGWRKGLIAAYQKRGIEIPKSVSESGCEDRESMLQKRRASTPKKQEIPTLGQLFAQLK